jgi:hypothetical protein
MDGAPEPRQWLPLRLLLLIAGAASLVTGLWGGLARIGVSLPMPQSADRHGMLMICGFFGTLISLERAVALRQLLAYAAPVLAALGVLILLLGIDGPLPLVAFLAASVALTIASGAIAVRQPALFTIGLAVAAAAWGIGTLVLLAGFPISDAAGWWLAFLVLTIAAERLELSRVLAPTQSVQLALAAALALIIAGAARAELSLESAPLMGLGFVGSALWLFNNDVARRTVRRSGQVRFFAACMLAGYTWLALAGLQLLAGPRAVFAYDAAVHAIAIGFVLSMVFGHALIIFPAVIGLPLRYTPVLYAPLALLQFSVAMRVLADLMWWSEARAVSAIVTVIALAAFAATVAVAAMWKPSVER